MDQLAHRAPEAHQYLSTMPPEVQEDLAGRLGGLAHETTIHEQNEFSDPRHISPEEYTPEQAKESERVGSMLTEAARLTQIAHDQLTEHGPIETDFYSSPADEVFDRAKDIALQEALQARDHGEEEAVQQSIQNALVLELLHSRQGRNSTSRETRFGALIAEGMADELLEVAQDMHGIVALSNSGAQSVTSVPRLLEPLADTIRIAANTDFDDQFQYPRTLVRPGQPEEDIERRNEILEGVNTQGLSLLAQEAAQQRENPDLAAHYARKAIEKLVPETLASGYEASSQTIVDVLVTADTYLDAANRGMLDDALQELRAARNAGLQPYRVNIPSSSIIDNAVIGLMEQNKPDMAASLLSVTPHELSNEQGIDYGKGNLEYALKVAIDSGTLDETKALEIKDVLQNLQLQKVTQFKQALLDSGAPPETIDNIISRSNDPDDALEIPEAFWPYYREILEGYDSDNDQLRQFSKNVSKIIEGEGSSNVASIARVILETRDNDLQPELLSPEIFTTLEQYIEPDERVDYLKSLVGISGQITSRKDLGYNQKLMLLGSLSRYRHPDEALKLATAIYGAEGLDHIHEMTNFLQNRYTYRPQEIEETFKHIVLETEFGSLLATTEHDYIKNELIRAIGEAANPTEKAERILEAFTTTEFVAIAERIGDDILQEMIHRAVIYSPDPVEEARVFTDISEQPEFTELMSPDGYPAEHGLRSTILSRIIHSDRIEETMHTLHEVFTESRFMSVIDTAGPGYGLRGMLIDTVLSSKDMLGTASSISKIFEGGGSLWHMTSQLAEMAVAGDFYCHGAQVSRIPVSLPLKSTTSYQEDAIKYIDGDEMLAHIQELYGVSPEAIDTARLNNGKVLISDMPQELQKTLLTAHLFEAITMSRSPDIRQQATERNQSIDPSSLFEAGNLHHVSRSGSFAVILQNGLLPGEFVSEQLRADSYPFNVDFVEANDTGRNMPTHRERLNALASSGFGDITLHIIRTGAEDSFRAGEEYAVEGSYEGQHRLIPGGFPATEISAVSIKNPETLEAIKAALLEAGMFMPVFSEDGEILYSYEQYQQDRRDGNYDVVVPEIVDSKFERPSSQGGSNEGAEFIVPSSIPGEAPDHYYCKFAQPENTEHLWSELLADELYRTVTPELVPETKPVILEGRLARASRMVEIDDQPITNQARNAGFIMDALLGNWDATFNQSNLVMSSGRAMRIDTGNALFFRARGGRKAPQEFGSTVTELEVGADQGNLGTGMRQNYPGLTDEDIQQQVEALQTQLTDEQIDKAVDSVRMPESERQTLKETLRARRDYIIAWSSQVAV